MVILFFVIRKLCRIGVVEPGMARETKGMMSTTLIQILDNCIKLSPFHNSGIRDQNYIPNLCLLVCLSLEKTKIDVTRFAYDNLLEEKVNNRSSWLETDGNGPTFG